MHETCQYLLYHPLLRMLVLPMVPALISMEWAIVLTMRSSESSEICWGHSRGNSPISKITSRPSAIQWFFSLPGLPMSNRLSVPFLPRWFHLKRRNRMSAPSHRMTAPPLHACARSKHMQPLLQAFLARQGRGPHRDKLTASQLQGPMTQGSSEEGRNTRRRLDTFSNPDDEIALSAVLSRSPCEQCHAGVSAWLKTYLQ